MCVWLPSLSKNDDVIYEPKGAQSHPPSICQANTNTNTNTNTKNTYTMQYILFVHPANTKSSHPHSICQANTNINTKNTNTMQCILFVTPILRPLTSEALFWLRGTFPTHGNLKIPAPVLSSCKISGLIFDPFTFC